MIALPQIQTAPEKPEWMEPCNGCGGCCAAEVCWIGKKMHGDEQPAPCPSMEFENGRFWCNIVRVMEGTSEGAFLKLRMGIGVGCDSEI